MHVGKTKDITGQKFGRLTVLELDTNSKEKAAKWICKCECGAIISTRGSSLRSGHTKSCGCFHLEDLIARKIRATHGKEGTRIYRIWQGVKNRCLNQNEPAYKKYGGRGITVCEEWKNNFQAFYNWAMESGYQDNLTIDRINNDGNYEPSNCRWTTAKIQANNRRSNRIVEYNGENITLSELSEKTGVPYGRIAHRLYRGWSVEEAVEKAVAGG